MNNKHKHPVGIASIGMCTPPFVLPLGELALLRNVDIDKYLIGLGLQEMSLCGLQTNVIDLATNAAKQALENWDGDIKDIGLLAVGTETPVDFSRPLSAWVASNLQISGYVRSYEVKHACYGGTLAIMQAVEWYVSSNQKKAALIIAVDEALYAQNHPGEPTQGAGAVAFIIGEPSVAEIDTKSIAYSEPVFDFWKPLNEVYPRVDGQYSLECYKKAAVACFAKAVNGKDPQQYFSELAAICCHVPYPRMVKKAFTAVCESLSLPEETINTLFQQKIEPNLEWNKRCGNAYTASLWIAVCNALARINTNDELVAFSYGSGLGAEILKIKKTQKNKKSVWADVFNQALNNRTVLTAQQYVEMRQNK